MKLDRRLGVLDAALIAAYALATLVVVLDVFIWRP